MMAETTTQRRRVTAKDFPKREIKLDVVEPIIAPSLPVWYLAPSALPAALAIFLPSLGAMWAAIAATIVWLGFYGLLLFERKRKDFDVGREIVLSITRTVAFGLALGAWGYVIYSGLR
ncbi:MAG: hypothetical protein SGI88_13590 [Candidatus Hydrogenedentes bacterium]|nr:hypothetical protein [Candidatus Hydrogenedentota bacterium]